MPMTEVRLVEELSMLKHVWWGPNRTLLLRPYLLSSKDMLGRPGLKATSV